MSILLIAVLFGLGFAYFATQNTLGVSVNFLQYQFDGIPLYLVALSSLLFGLLISWLLSLVDGIANMFSLRGKDHKIHETQRTVGHLEERIHDLEIENAKLKGIQETIEEIPVREKVRHV